MRGVTETRLLKSSLHCSQFFYDRVFSTTPPTSDILNYIARLREEPPNDPGFSADENVPPSATGLLGQGEPMLMGVGNTTREFCDGRTLVSPGRWPVQHHRYPDSSKGKNSVRQVHTGYDQNF